MITTDQSHPECFFSPFDSMSFFSLSLLPNVARLWIVGFKIVVSIF